MGKVTKVEVIVKRGSEVLTARIKKKGQKRFGKKVVLKGGEEK